MGCKDPGTWLPRTGFELLKRAGLHAVCQTAFESKGPFKSRSTVGINLLGSGCLVVCMVV